MNNDLAPTYQRLFGHYWVLWYSKSNNYSIVEPEFKELLDIYIQANSKDKFFQKLTTIDSTSNTVEVANNLESYLLSCNSINPSTSKVKTKHNKPYLKISKLYSIKGKLIQINFDSDLVKQTIHPAIAHLEINEHKNDIDVSFDIYLDNDQLFLLKNNEPLISVPKRNYHIIQGKFIFHLISAIHNKKESDWIATFHGSTITDGKNSILLIGNSGKGKSTLSTILAASDFNILADDVSPILLKNNHIYYNPLAISIKEGSFNVLKPLIKEFDNIPSTTFNKSKGILKYIPFPAPKSYHYPCKTIVMVNYSENSEFILKPITVKETLEVLIAESWLSHNPTHVKQFLDWLDGVNTIELTYGNNDNIIKLFHDLFNKINNN